MAEPPYTLEFYEEENGREPVLDWIRKRLTPTQRRAITVALEEILAYEGLGVMDAEFGKPTSETGIHEFRLRQDDNELVARIEARRAARGDSPLNAEVSGEDQSGKKKRAEKVFLRVFFHAHGDKMILLLGGYDKNRNKSPRKQNEEIGLAAKRLADWKQRQRAAAKAAKRAAPPTSGGKRRR